MVNDLEAARGGPPLEVAFYGGTFTALPDTWVRQFLETAARYRRLGLVTAVRCSTRPDACDPDLLRSLAAMGLDMVELGVQTFADAVLRAARRGHDARDTLRACDAVRAAGLGLGLQLLPGLPGHTPEELGRDIARCLAVGPDMVRLHPCLVLAGTGLEGPWRSGSFAPWPLDLTVRELARAVLALWRADIAVARVGLAFEPALERAVLAGPRHPALGTMVRARALFLEIRERLGGRPPLSLAVPQRRSGEFWGHARELEPEYAALGLGPENVAFANRPDFLLDVMHNE